MNTFPVSLSQRRAQGLITTLLVALGLAFLAFAADSMVTSLATAAPVERVSLTGADVAVYNLAGVARLEAGSGSAVQVMVTRGGADGGDLEIQRDNAGGRATLRVIYPGKRIIYPEMGRGSSTTVRVHEDGTFGGNDKHGDWLGGSVKISGSGTGTEAHADLVVSIPRGQKFSLYLACGNVTASNVDGELKVDTGSGTVSTNGTKGGLLIDTGSGEINVGGATGPVSLDTGSGDVNVSGISGDDLKVDTGSGSIRAREISATKISFDTGSGDVEGSNLKASTIAIDTGSGSVDLGLSSLADDIAIDTGSGSVTLRVPRDFGAEISFESGSGDFDSDLPVTMRHREHGSFRGRVGDGSARVVVETGSGDMTLATNATRR